MTEVSGGTKYFADPLGGLAAEEWDELARDRFYSSAFWLRLCAMEAGGAAGGLHVDLPGGGRAAVPVIAVGDDPHPNCRWADMLAARGLPSPPGRGMLVGQLRGYLAHLLGPEHADPAAVAARLLAEVRAARPPVSADAMARVGLYLTTPDVLALREAGVRAMPVLLGTDAWMEIPPGGWEAWLESLGSSHRVRRILSEVRRFERAGYRVEQRTLGEAYADVARLAFQVEQRYGRARSIDPYLEGFRLQGTFAGPRAQVLLCSYDDGPPVGCCLYYRDGDTIYLRAAGFDYARLRGAAEYFNMAYYVPARLPGVRWLHAGTATPDGKALRGARLRPLWLLDLSRDSVLERCGDEVRAHNATVRADLAGMSPAVAAALRDESWETFF
jgi:uncharacterized protein